MKKIICLALAGAICFSFAGCNKKNTEYQPENNDNKAVTEPEEKVSEFYAKMEESDSRPIAVMIDNDGDYKGPHSGLENAYLIYEAYVEGGGTRMMALFNGDFMTDEEKAERIGPVRSSRHYFLDFALENDAIYAHCGFSPQAQSEISSRGVNNINGLYESAPFERYSEYNKSWHNLYTSYAKLKTAADSHKYRETTDEKLLYAKNIEDLSDGTAATEVSIPYLLYTMSYTYDSEKGVYMRFKKGAPHTMQSGVQLSFENVVILRMQNSNLNDGSGKGRQDLADTGTGSGTYITNGKSVPITWKKADRSARCHLYFENGDEVELNPGKTFIQIVPNDMNVTIS